jgi:riboflavin biosynthesis pyrimidine reductase
VTEPLELKRLADLSDDDLSDAYAPAREPWLRVNFVSTVDGAAQGSDGVSSSINDAADKRVFDMLRARAHCLVVGAGTLRAEEYDVPKVPLVVVSRSAGLPPTLREAPPGRILMATVASAAGLAQSREQLGEDHVLVLGEDEIARVVDELCWTVVPRLTGGDAVRIATGASVDVGLRPVSLLEQDGTLLGRWIVS